MSTDVLLESAPNGTAYRLTDDNSFQVTKPSAQHIYGLDALSLSFAIKRDAVNGGEGDIIRVHGDWRVILTDSGELEFDFYNADGDRFIFTTSGAGLADTDWHAVSLTYDSDVGIARFYVDGASVGQMQITGLTPPAGVGGFAVGNPHGANFNGLISSVELRKDALDAAAIESKHEQLLQVDLSNGETDHGSIDPIPVPEPIPDPVIPTDEDESEIEIEGSRITGTEESDSLHGTDMDDYADLLGGDDYYNGGDGDDLVYAGAGNDRVDGYGGIDTVFGGAGDDRLYANVAYGEDGNDYLLGDEDIEDMLDGGTGNDVLAGYSGNDSLFGGDGQDTLKGGDGDDLLDAGFGDDTVHAGNGNDTLLGGDGIDSLAGNDGDDFIDGGAGRDVLIGGMGNDRLVFDSQDKEIRGDQGYDSLLVITDSSTVADVSAVRLRGIEHVDATNGQFDMVSIGHLDAKQSDTGSLTVSGDQGDVVVFEMEHSLDFLGKSQVDGKSYYEFNSTRYSDERIIRFSDDLVVTDEEGNVLAGQENLGAISPETVDKNDAFNSIFDGDDFAIV